MPAKQSTRPPAAQREQYGPRGDSPGIGMTLQEVADAMGVTRERVRQIEQMALKKAARVLAVRYGVNPGNASRVLFDILGH